MEVPVTINSRIAGYDRLLVLGPVFPHEAVGFSGGNKYFFPGIAGPDILNFFHWLGWRSSPTSGSSACLTRPCGGSLIEPRR